MGSDLILYRYRPAFVRELDSLLDSQIYLSRPDDFDDPWDCALVSTPEARSAISNLRVACFAESDDDTRFWSHYATYHQGICIGYRVVDLPVDSSSFHQVSYTNIHPGFPPEIAKDSPEAFDAATLLLTTKCEAWGAQSEWRIILAEPSARFLEHPQDAIASVTFGLRTHAAVRQFIVNRLGFNPTIEFREILKKDGVMLPQSVRCEIFPEVGVDLSSDARFVPPLGSGWTADKSDGQEA